jgi:repressor LexA
MPLTKRQREILNYLTAYSEQNGFAPSFEEIAENFAYNSLATVHEHLTNLERKGYIKRNYNESRAIEILPTRPRRARSSFRCSAAWPPACRSKPSNTTKRCAFRKRSSAGRQPLRLRVRGNSMIDEQIRDGDFVVVNERQRADNGEMVIALLNGLVATVKKFYRERDGRIRLQPANETMQPMYVHENDISIQGIVVGVLRRY